jgi:hypothetical protein
MTEAQPSVTLITCPAASSGRCRKTAVGARQLIHPLRVRNRSGGVQTLAIRNENEKDYVIAKHDIYGLATKVAD